MSDGISIGSFIVQGREEFHVAFTVNDEVDSFERNLSLSAELFESYIIKCYAASKRFSDAVMANRYAEDMYLNTGSLQYGITHRKYSVPYPKLSLVEAEKAIAAHLKLIARLKRAAPLT